MFTRQYKKIYERDKQRCAYSGVDFLQKHFNLIEPTYF